MKASDPLINQALSKVRNAQPPAGMQQRVLAGVEKRISLRPRHPLSRILRLQILPSYSWQIALGAALIAVVTTFVFLHTGSPQQATFATDAKQPRLHPLHVVAPALGNEKLTVAVKRTSAGQPIRRTVAAGARVEQSHLAVLDDLHAPSRPAPELPLTAQEKLLLNVAHQGDPVEIASLDPVVQDSLAADEKLAFDSFFQRKSLSVQKRNMEVTNELSK